MASQRDLLDDGLEREARLEAVEADEGEVAAHDGQRLQGCVVGGQAVPQMVPQMVAPAIPEVQAVELVQPTVPAMMPAMVTPPGC